MPLKGNRSTSFGQGGLLLAVLLIWEVVGWTSARFEFVMSRPSSVVGAFVDLLLRGGLLIHFSVTALEAVGGLVLGVIVGSGLGLAFWYSSRWAAILRPYVTALASIPLFALAPLMILWFGVGVQMKVAMAFFATAPVCLSQSFQGALSVSDEHLAILRGLGASRMQTLAKAVIPGAMSWVLASMRVAGGLSLLGAFMGEFISSERGLGHLVLRASGLYDVPRALAASAGIAALALMFDRVGVFLERRAEGLIELLSVPRVVRTHSVKR